MYLPPLINTTIDGASLLSARVALKSEDGFSGTEYVAPGTIRTSQLVHEATPAPAHATILEGNPPLVPNLTVSESTGFHTATFTRLTFFFKGSESPSPGRFASNAYSRLLRYHRPNILSVLSTKAILESYEQVEVRDYVEVWTFKGIIASQQYLIPAGANLDRAISVAIC